MIDRATPQRAADDVRPLSGVRGRTRRAILDAAIAVLGADPAASLGDVAAAAEVSRTTVHRYFPERADLVRALAEDAGASIDAAVVAARLEDGPALDALLRLAREYFAVGAIVPFLHAETESSDPDDWVVRSPSSGPLARVVARGQEAGELRASFSASWVHQVVWAIVYAGWENVRDHGVPPAEALDLVLAALTGALAAR